MNLIWNMTDVIHVAGLRVLQTMLRFWISWTETSLACSTMQVVWMVVWLPFQKEEGMRTDRTRQNPVLAGNYRDTFLCLWSRLAVTE